MKHSTIEYLEDIKPRDTDLLYALIVNPLVGGARGYPFMSAETRKKKNMQLNGFVRCHG